MTVLLPLRTKSPNGSHGHWAATSARRKRERATARLMCPKLALPCVVKLTRLSAGTLDFDNLVSSMKHVRDGCADALGVADNDPRIDFQYGQIRGKRGEFGVWVEVVPMTLAQSVGARWIKAKVNP